MHDDIKTRKHSPVPKADLISFCRENIKILDELNHLNFDDLKEGETHEGLMRKIRIKNKEILPIIQNRFNYKDKHGALTRILCFYHYNIKIIKDELSEADKKAIDDYSFQIPYDGTNDFYNKEKAKHFEAGLVYARKNPSI